MWSKDEVKFLRENYRRKTAEMISNRVNRSKNAIYQKANESNLESEICGSGKIWSEKEKKILREKYPIKNTSELSKELDRTELSIRNKARKLGITKSNELVDKKRGKALDLFLKGRNVEEISEKLGVSNLAVQNSLLSKKRLEYLYNEEDLTQGQIGNIFAMDQSQISEKMEEFGIETDRSERWGEKEVELLKDNYLEVSKSKLLSLLPKRSWSGIKSKAQKLDLTRSIEEYRNSEEVRSKLRSISKKNIIQVDFQETDTISYILGVIDGDGFHDGEFTLGLEVNSIEFAEKFYMSLEKIGLNPGKGKRDRNDLNTVWASSKQFVDWYKDIRKDNRAKWLTHNGNKWKYIEGRYESDGNIHPSGSPRITSTDNKELKLISRILSDLSIKCSIQKDNIWISKSSSKDFFKNIDPVIKKRGSKEDV